MLLKSLLNKIPVITNQCRFNVFWNIFILIFILFSSIVISYRISFGLIRPDIYYWIIVFVFAMDVFLSFFMDIRIKYEVICDQRMIARNY